MKFSNPFAKKHNKIVMPPPVEPYIPVRKFKANLFCTNCGHFIVLEFPVGSVVANQIKTCPICDYNIKE